MSQLEPTENKEMIKVKSMMKQDEVSHVAHKDPLITKLGEVLLERVGLSRSREVSQSMRELARLLMELKKNSPGTDDNQCNNLQEYFKPEAFDDIVGAVHSLCRFTMNHEEASKKVGIPSLALRLGNSIKKCSFILKGQALRNKDSSAVEEQGFFEQLMENEWNNKVSYHSLSELATKSRNKIDLLPLTSDLEILRKHLLSQINDFSRELKAKPSLNLWQKLAEYILCRLIVFNKRRGGEASRMLATEYKTRPDWKTQQIKAVQDGLQPLEKKLSERLDLVEIRGKRGRSVPVILTKEIKKGIDLLLSSREEVGINPRNPYVFANCQLGYLRDWEVFQKISSNKELGLKQPHAIRSTRLRKYIATVSQVLALNENELDWLARHMGHDVRIHREYYRLHTSTLELAKVSKILATVDLGEIGNWAGKSLSDIEIKLDDEDFNTDEESEEEEDTNDDEAGREKRPASKKLKKQEQNCQEEEVSADNTDNKKSMKKRPEKTVNNEGKPKKKPRTFWSKEEKSAVIHHLGSYLSKTSLPGKAECLKCIKKSEPVLDQRDWKSVKYYIKDAKARAKKALTE